MITVIGNFKGGTGKSTVAFNLAIWLASQGRKVAVESPGDRHHHRGDSERCCRALL